MLDARSVAVVGASRRPGSFGQRLVGELSRSTSDLAVHLVNPRESAAGTPGYVSSLDDVEGPVDLVLLGVPDRALEAELARAARRGDRAAVVFGGAHGESSTAGTSLRDRLADIARRSGVALCGAGCMGFVNVSNGLRAVGYVEAEAIPNGPIALVTHSGSVFSALLRTRRGLGFTVAVSSGQELVTTAAQYIDYALELPGTRVVALVLEAVREADALRQALERASRSGVIVVALTLGRTRSGRQMVAAHSGALAGVDGGWEALFDAYGVTRVGDLEELVDTLELFAAGRRASRGSGIATVHDSGAERALAVDLADELGVRFAPISDTTRETLGALLDPGLAPDNPLDVWGAGRDTATLFSGCIRALAADDEVSAVALAVDLVHEYDGDDSYVVAALDAAAATATPVAVLTGLPAAVDGPSATRLRAGGVPVLEGTRSGLLALQHLVDARHPPRLPPARIAMPEDAARGSRRERWLDRIASRPLAPSEALALLADYGIATARSTLASSPDEASRGAGAIGFPVVMKTDDESVSHKSDVGGVVLGVGSPDAARGAYEDLARRFGPRVLVSETAPAGVEVALGLARDPALGLLAVAGAGGVLVEHLGDRSVALLDAVDLERAHELLSRLRVARLFDGVRGTGPVDRDSIARALVALARIGADLADAVDAIDVNPLLCGPGGAVAVDALVVARRGR